MLECMNNTTLENVKNLEFKKVDFTWNQHY